MDDEVLVRSLVEAAGLAARSLRIAPISGGTINRTFRLERDDMPPMVLRIAPSDADVSAGPSWLTSHGLRREQEVIRLLAELSPLLPETVFFDETRNVIDRDWVIQTVVPGRPWTEVRASLDDREQRILWRELGEITSRIHAVTGEEFGPPEAGYGTTTWADLLRWDATGMTVDANRYGIDPAPMEALIALVDGSVPLLDAIDQPRLIHSDLGLHHVFVTPGEDGAHHISGMIDFEFGRFADPLSDGILLEHALIPAVDDDAVAFCEGYACPTLTRDDERRRVIYRAVALGWTVMDLVRRDLRDHVPTLLAKMQTELRQAEKAV